MSDTAHIETLRDELLELEIGLAGKRSELEMALASQTTNTVDRNARRAEAERQLRVMERLIQSRRPEAVTRLEAERGLSA